MRSPHGGSCFTNDKGRMLAKPIRPGAATALTSGTLKCCSADDSRLAEFSLSSAPQLPSALGSSRRARLPCFLLEPAADACGVPLNACDFRPANGLLFLSLAD